MRNFIVTIDGKSYSVGVDEVENGVVAESTPVQAVAPVAPKAQKISAEGCRR